MENVDVRFIIKKLIFLKFIINLTKKTTMNSISEEDLLSISRGNPGAVNFLSQKLLNENQITLIKNKNITGPALWILWSEYAQKDKENLNIILDELSKTGKCIRFILRVNEEIDFMEYAKPCLSMDL